MFWIIPDYLRLFQDIGSVFFYTISAGNRAIPGRVFPAILSHGKSPQTLDFQDVDVNNRGGGYFLFPRFGNVKLNMIDNVALSCLFPTGYKHGVVIGF